jgi:hypothetical protein
VIPENRLYPIQNQGYDFFTGVCDDGRQVVMGLLCPHVVAYFFDAQGNLLADEHRPWNKAAPRFGFDGPYKIYDDDFQVALTKQMQEWQTDLGFQKRTVHIRAFMDDRHRVGIELLPEHLRNLESADWFDDDEERQEYIASREEWLADGKFVWWWAKDYFMEKDGSVESS